MYIIYDKDVNILNILRQINNKILMKNEKTLWILFLAIVCGVLALPAQEKKYSQWFADSEMARFPEAWQLDHGKRLFFGYAQGVGCCAMLKVWKQTGDSKYYDYVHQWADSIIYSDGTIHKYTPETYNIDFINS